MPDSLRFLIVVCVLAGLGYAGLWALASHPPEQTDVVKTLSNEKLKQK